MAVVSSLSESGSTKKLSTWVLWDRIRQMTQKQIYKRELTDIWYSINMESGMRTINPCGLNKLFGSKFQEGNQVWEKPLFYHFYSFISGSYLVCRGKYTTSLFFYYGCFYDFFYIRKLNFSGLDHILSFTEYDVIRWILIFVPMSADEFKSSSMWYGSVTLKYYYQYCFYFLFLLLTCFRPSFIVSIILSAIKFNWGDMEVSCKACILFVVAMSKILHCKTLAQC